MTLADPSAACLSLAAGERVEQRPFRGLLRSRGGEVPYIGDWFFIGEATREMARGEPIAVLELDLDWEARASDAVVVGDLRFRSPFESELDTRETPRRVVSEAARSVKATRETKRREDGYAVAESLGSARCSSAREVISSLAKTFRR